MTTQIDEHAVTALTLRAAFKADQVEHDFRILP